MKKFDTLFFLLNKDADKQVAEHKAAYMRNQFDFFGLPTPLRRQVSEAHIEQDRKTGIVDWDFLDRCWDARQREFQYFVNDYLKAFQKYLTYDDIPRIERYVRTKQWWDTIDSLDKIIGNIGLRDNRVNDLMLAWSVDEDFWVRRVAIDHQILRKQSTDTALMETILTNNFGSKEFFINKAIGWCLRDYSKTNPEWVRGFLEKYRSRMSNLSIREASKYV